MQVPWLDHNYYEMVLGALALVVVLSLLLERALAVIFEWGVWREGIANRKLRAPIALGVSYVICISFNFDVLSILFYGKDGYSGESFLGPVITAVVIAGGSKGAILLFQGVLGFGQEAVNARIQARVNSQPPPKPEDGKSGGGEGGQPEVEKASVNPQPPPKPEDGRVGDGEEGKPEVEKK